MIKLPYSIPQCVDFEDRDFCQELEIKVANYFDVYPVDGKTAYIELIDDAGGMNRAVFRSFVYAAEGRQHSKMVSQLCAALWEQIKNTFPADSAVMWRLRPTIKEEEISDTCESCGHVKEVRYRTYVRCRIACIGMPDLGANWLQEGSQAPILEIKNDVPPTP